MLEDMIPLMTTKRTVSGVFQIRSSGTDTEGQLLVVVPLKNGLEIIERKSKYFALKPFVQSNQNPA